jgi:hypothetical protein
MGVYSNNQIAEILFRIQAQMTATLSRELVASNGQLTGEVMRSIFQEGFVEFFK